MAQLPRTRLVRVPKEEYEIHLFNNPIDDYDQRESSSPRPTHSSPSQKSRDALSEYDYQAPLTSHSLRPNSYWLIVRRNLHRIRCMGFSDTGTETRLPDFYLGLQMTRELKRAQEEIKNIDKDVDFRVITEFSLTNDTGHSEKFDTSHVKPEDALMYDRLGEEPLALQNLLFYFSRQEVQHGTVFWNFLNEVNHVLKLNRKRTVLVQRLQRLAFTIAIIFYTFVGLMFFLMVISVISTVTKMNDPEVQWMDHKIGGYSSNIFAVK